MCCTSGHKLKNRVIQGWYLIQILLELYLGHQSIHLVAQRDQGEEMSMRPCRKRSSVERVSGAPYLAINTESKSKREWREKERVMEKSSKYQSAVSMNAEAKPLSMVLYMGLKNKIKKNKSIVNFSVQSSFFSELIYFAESQHKQGLAKNSRQIRLCQAVLYKQFHYSKT